MAEHCYAKCCYAECRGVKGSAPTCLSMKEVTVMAELEFMLEVCNIALIVGHLWGILGHQPGPQPIHLLSKIGRLCIQ